MYIMTWIMCLFNFLKILVHVSQDFLEIFWLIWRHVALSIQKALIVVKMFGAPSKFSLARLVNKISVPARSCIIAKIKVKGQNQNGLSVISRSNTNMGHLGHTAQISKNLVNTLVVTVNCHQTLSGCLSSTCFDEFEHWSFRN
jgi:hypothetical protein